MSRFLTSEGEEREEYGTIEDGRENGEGLKIEGFYSYSENKKLYKKHYIGDSSGSKFEDVTAFPQSKISESLRETTTVPPLSNQSLASVPYIFTGAVATLAGGGLG